MIKDVMEALRFAWSPSSWDMFLWSIALFSSYLKLLRASIFDSKSTPISSSIVPKIGSSRPICVVTGVSKNNQWLIRPFPNGYFFYVLRFGSIL